MAENNKSVIDYTSSTDYDLQPFYGAGTITPVEWIHRKKGDTVNAAAVISDGTDEGIDESDKTTVVLGGSNSGMAGTNFYQVNVSLMSLSSNNG